MAKPKVYYNGACPVCNAGIKKQRQLLEPIATQVEWIDIGADNGAVREIDADL